MFEILEKRWLSEKICLMEVKAKELSYSAKPGHFVIVKTNQKSERVPLTICDFNHERKSITLVYQILGKSTLDMSKLEVGERFQDISGPLGHYSELIDTPMEELKKKKFLFIGGGVGIAPVYPQLKWMTENNLDYDVILGARDQSLLILEDEIRKLTDNVYVCTDDGSLGLKGNVVNMMTYLVEELGKNYDQLISIGPLPMMKFSTLKAKEYNLPTVVSLNPLMIDGTGMCGACRVSIGKDIKFACVDGPEFDGYLVDFDEAMRRQNMYKTEEGKSLLSAEDGYKQHAKGCGCGHDSIDKNIEQPFDKKKAVPMREYEPEKRVKNFLEVTYGYNIDEALKESTRCLECKNPKCREGCPVGIDIPGFIKEIKTNNLKGSAEVLAKYTLLPAICGRVCPQETQCEEKCIVGIKGDAVKIGRLERFVGDWMLDHHPGSEISEKKSQKVAVIGSGPSGLTAASELAKKGYSVTVYEALHELGGVLTYGIPEFRLPKDNIVRREIENIKKLGVEFVTNYIVGKTYTIDELFSKKGFDAIFIGSGAGLPKFMNIPGENLNGVTSANEFLTRINLMRAHEADYDTPVKLGKKVIVVGGGNVAMDAARTAARLGVEVTVVYRRRQEDLPARLEEIHHAMEEGIKFRFLTNPLEVLGDDHGNVVGLKCLKMHFSQPADGGRAEVKAIEGTDFFVQADTVIMSLGTTSNPIITNKSGIELTKYNYIKAGEGTTKTSREGVYAGGDIVTGAATVILAMGAGKQAAEEIDEYLINKKK